MYIHVFQGNQAFYARVYSTMGKLTSHVVQKLVTRNILHNMRNMLHNMLRNMLHTYIQRFSTTILQQCARGPREQLRIQLNFINCMYVVTRCMHACMYSYADSPVIY